MERIKPYLRPNITRTPSSNSHLSIYYPRPPPASRPPASLVPWQCSQYLLPSPSSSLPPTLLTCSVAVFSSCRPRLPGQSTCSVLPGFLGSGSRPQTGTGSPPGWSPRPWDSFHHWEGGERERCQIHPTCTILIPEITNGHVRRRQGTLREIHTYTAFDMESFDRRSLVISQVQQKIRSAEF